MEYGLRGRFVRFEPSSRGPQAIVELEEINLRKHRVRCLAMYATTEIGDVDNAEFDGLIERFGKDQVFWVARRAVPGWDAPYDLYRLPFWRPIDGL